MRLKDFGYSLPPELIAQEPLKERDQCRLLVIDRKARSIRHDIFTNINRYLPPQSVIVLNDSKVVPARLFGKKEKTGGKVEIFLLKQLEDGYTYEVLMRPQKRLKAEDKIIFDASPVQARVVSVEKRTVCFNRKNLSSFLKKQGHMPLPPYIKREDRPADRTNYQTIFAKKEGSVASPTAGLHFTKELLSRLAKDGHKFERLTLHINYATFRPVETSDITRHKMHSERYEIARNAWARISRARKEGKSIVAVGTTSCRVLETVAGGGKLKGNSEIFIYPGFKFRATDALVTNFHLPFSTLLMLVAAFAGKDLIDQAYREAVKEKYRFYSYGDAMLIV